MRRARRRRQRQPGRQPHQPHQPRTRDDGRNSACRTWRATADPRTRSRCRPPVPRSGPAIPPPANRPRCRTSISAEKPAARPRAGVTSVPMTVGAAAGLCGRACMSPPAARTRRRAQPFAGEPVRDDPEGAQLLDERRHDQPRAERLGPLPGIRHDQRRGRHHGTDGREREERRGRCRTGRAVGHPGCGRERLRDHPQLHHRRLRQPEGGDRHQRGNPHARRGYDRGQHRARGRIANITPEKSSTPATLTLEDSTVSENDATIGGGVSSPRSRSHRSRHAHDRQQHDRR